MKKCLYCGTLVNDDCLFCTECGKELPKETVCPHCGAIVIEGDVFCTECGKELSKVNVCPHCGASVNEGDVFCTECGKEIEKEDEHSSMDEVVQVEELKPILQDTTPIEETKDNVIIEEYEEQPNSIKKYLPFVIGGIVILAIIIGFYVLNNSDNKSPSKQIEAVDSVMTDSNSTDESDEVQAKIQFLEKFYKEKDKGEQQDEYAYIKQNVTANGLQDLKDFYDYDCEGECLATWVFDYDSGSDIGDLKTSKITSAGGNDFLVEKDYEYARYCVLLTVVKDGNDFKIDKIEQKESSYFFPKQDETESLDWLQGHWVYEHGNYKAHIIIDGDKVIQYSTMNPEKYEKAYTINGDELHAKLIDGMDLVIKIDFANQRIDYGDGQWMHKISSSDRGYSSGSSNTLSTKFLGADYVVGYLANHKFTDNSGLDIRFDGDGRIYIDGDCAGVVSVLRWNETSALLRYGGGAYGEGKIAVTIEGNGRMRLTDPVDGTVWYQK